MARNRKFKKTDSETITPEGEARKGALRQEIMTCMKANGIHISGETWFTLVFRTEAELTKIARELHIAVAKPSPLPVHPYVKKSIKNGESGLTVWS